MAGAQESAAASQGNVGSVEGRQAPGHGSGALGLLFCRDRAVGADHLGQAIDGAAAAERTVNLFIPLGGE